MTRVSHALVLLALGCFSVTTASAQPPPWNAPGQAVGLGDGRSLNLYCSGEGSPAVVLNSGLGHGAEVWFRVQPELARVARVCSFDRAGYRYSAAGPMPRSLEATASDIHLALRAAKIPGPYVLVGHSLGADQVGRFARRYREDVAGLVLVDPGVDAAAAKAIGASAFEALDDGASACVEAAAEGKMRAGEPLFEPCGSPPAGSFAASRTMAQAVLSELHESRLEREEGDSLGTLPLIVLTAGRQFAGHPVNQAHYRSSHARQAALSSVGVHTIVESGHVIHFEKPDAVIDAIRQVLERARAR